MNRTCVFFGIAAAVSAVLCFSAPAFSDTVILRDGERVKGLIVDEFKDRIILSTPGGERAIMRTDIRSAVYDNEQKALMQRGRSQLKRGQYLKAYQTYEKAVMLDPEQPEALERLHYLRSYLETKTRYDITEGVRRHREVDGEEEGITPVRELKESLGLVLAPGEKFVHVLEYKPVGPAGAGTRLKEGDKIVEVWGEMTAYMDEDEVAEALLAPGEVKATIEREVFPALSSAGGISGALPWGYRKITGASLGLRREGVTVTGVRKGGPFEAAGIKKGDILFRVQGKNTRYMPMSELVEMIRRRQGEKIDIVIRRGLTLWRKE